ncbi:hypothetical protein [Lysobacter enzymogenes]|uniref:hypothetical protein n=1 Tax=Lysobacter enzymogenes TaxID=69 RepID=UPI001F14B640|nr:hypothetical protein [Lysobacter enzymogenes]
MATDGLAPPPDIVIAPATAATAAIAAAMDVFLITLRIPLSPLVDETPSAKRAAAAADRAHP